MASPATEEPHFRPKILWKEKTIYLQDKKPSPDEIKHVLTGERFTDCNEIALVKVMNPIYIDMRFFGLLWNKKQNLFPRKCSIDLSTLHCCLVLLFAWFNFFKYFAAYDSSDTYGSRLFRKISFQVIDLQFACGITSNVYYMQKNMPNFVMLWENYKIRHGGVPLATLRRNMLIRIISINLVAFLFTLAFVVALFLTNEKLFFEYHFPLLTRYGVTIPDWLLYIVSGLYTYITFAWMQSLIICICMNKNIREEFAELSSQFNTTVRGCKRTVSTRVRNSSSFPKETLGVHEQKNQTEQYRQRHLELCKLTSTFDDAISSYLLSIYLFSVPVIVIFIFILWGTDGNSAYESMVLITATVSSLLFYIIVIVSVTASSSALSSAVSVQERKLFSGLHSFFFCLWSAHPCVFTFSKTIESIFAGKESDRNPAFNRSDELLIGRRNICPGKRSYQHDQTSVPKHCFDVFTLVANTGYFPGVPSQSVQ